MPGQKSFRRFILINDIIGDIVSDILNVSYDVTFFLWNIRIHLLHGIGNDTVQEVFI